MRIESTGADQIERAVVANRDDGKGVVLWCAGKGIEEEVSATSPRLDDLGLDDAPEGISIWEGCIVTRKCGNPLYGVDYETELVGKFRDPSDAEWAEIHQGRSPW